MSNIYATFYWIRLKKRVYKKQKDEYFKMGDIYGKNIDEILYNHLQRMLNNSEKYENNQQTQTVSKIIYFEKNEKTLSGRKFYNSINCVIEHGIYGNPAKIIDTTSGVYETKGEQKKGDAPVRPFVFSIFYKNDSDRAILAIQSIGVHTVTSCVKKYVKDAINYFSNECHTQQGYHYISAEILNLAPKDYVTKLIEEGKIKNISIVTHKKRSLDISDDKMIDSESKILKLKNPVYRSKSKLVEMISGEVDTNALGGLVNADDEIEDIAYEIDNNGSTQTIKYSTFYNFKVSENITNCVVIDSEGYATRESLFRKIDASALNYLRMLNIVGSDISGDLSTVKNDSLYFDVEEAMEEGEENSEITV